MKTDFRALCAELLLFAVEAGEIAENEGLWPDCDPDCALITRARAALAAEPVGQLVNQTCKFTESGEGPSDQELEAIELALWDRHRTKEWGGEEFMYDNNFSYANFSCALEEYRAILAHWGRPTPQPVPASGRLPGPGDCTAQGWCWVFYRGFATWTLEPPLGQDGKHTGYTHWLPAHALPLPQAGDGE